MKNPTCSCSRCGRDLSREVVNRAYARYQEELASLLAQPEPDRARIAFLTFLISALDRRFGIMKEKAS